MAKVHRVFYGSDKVATRRFCAGLQSTGHAGCIAAALFHAQKSSSRAKKYRGGIPTGPGRRVSYSKLAYQRKGNFLEKLASLLSEDNCGMVWGWGVDPNDRHASHVLYIDLPQGQVSFHSTQRFAGPDYPAQWDGKKASEHRVLAFCHAVASAHAAERLPVPVEAIEVEGDADAD